jgi:hypothetical protein
MQCDARCCHAALTDGILEFADLQGGQERGIPSEIVTGR